ncbi:MAG: SCO family protein [Sphingomonadaceae bacterium]
MKVLIALAVALLLLLPGCAAPPSVARGPGLSKTDMKGRESPDFSLVDHDGRPLGLMDLRGKAVALTFLYSSCPDVCPVVTTTFGQAWDRLGDDRRKVALVAISVDPERDTVSRLRQYLETMHLQGKMVFLTGERAALEAVWKDYYVGVSKGPVEAGPAGAGGFYYVSHSTPTYLIDPGGRQRVMIRDTDFTAEQLVAELRPLMREAR